MNAPTSPIAGPDADMPASTGHAQMPAAVERADGAGLSHKERGATAQPGARRLECGVHGYDALTALPNHALFRQRLGQALDRAAGTGRPVQVATVDLDLYRRVNSWFGQDAGERLLQDMARRIEALVGPEVAVARESSDRFLVLLEGDQCLAEAGTAQGIAATLAEPLDFAGHPVYAACCIGIASFPGNGSDADALLCAADRALRRAQASGPGSLRYADTSIDKAELDRFQLGAALRDAFAAGELRLHYQPQVDLVTGQISTVEALVRWRRGDDEVPAATLIGAAESCGLIGELGDWVLRTACAQAAAWRAMGFSALRIAVNLSTRQLSTGMIEASVNRALSETGLPPECLDLELAESALMYDMNGSMQFLLALQERGIRLCLDHFGTGTSSLAQLRRLPIDVLKIDQSFLNGVPEADQAAAIVDAVIVMGHSLGMRVVAVGVEHEAQCEYLARHMCDEVQGYLVSEPVAGEVLTRMLHDGAGLSARLLRFDRAQPTLLLVDDEPSILSSLKRLLRGDGYRILTANSGQAGLDVLAEHAVDVIVSDQRMPGMTGVEFLRTVRQSYPETVRIVLSGFTELQTVTDAVNAGAIYKFLTKPWDDGQLRAHVQEAFTYGAMANENRLLTLQVHTANQKLAAVNRRLESLLARQRRELEYGAISLDIAHEVLNNVPVAVLASDDLGTIVLANRAASCLFAEHGTPLGHDLHRLFPCLPALLPEGAGLGFEYRGQDGVFPASLHPMGHGSQSRGWLITVTGFESHLSGQS
ncbi:diguanylate cyclase (GGDEF)-like protein [Massilia sp. UYP11]|uniref:EAL domain-containing protein n=1 Tax=Massilia sp. UYP11 TaxID=1756385 RepID=UPI003D1A11DA